MNPKSNLILRLLSLSIGTVLRGTILILTGTPRVRNQSIPSGPTMLIAKHSSHFDTLVLWAAADKDLRARLRPVAAKDYWDKGFSRRFVAKTILNALLLDRRQTRCSDPIGDMEKALSEGACLLVFPEGTRNAPDDVGAFKSGIYRLAQRVPEVSLVPTWIENAGATLPKGDIVPTPMNCHVSMGVPLKLAANESQKTFMERARDAVCALHLPLTHNWREGGAA